MFKDAVNSYGLGLVNRPSFISMCTVCIDMYCIITRLRFGRTQVLISRIYCLHFIHLDHNETFIEFGLAVVKISS